MKLKEDFREFTTVYDENDNEITMFPLSRAEQMEKHIEKMFYMAGFVSYTDPMDRNPMSHINQVETFIRENNIKINVDNFDKNNTIYTMSKNGEDILFFIEQTNYDEENFKMTISLSNIKEI